MYAIRSYYEWLTSVSYSRRRKMLAFSRMRSNTTIESCIEKPITVSRAVRKSESISQPKSSPPMAVV